MLKRFVGAMTRSELAELLDVIGERVFTEHLLSGTYVAISAGAIQGIANNLRVHAHLELNEAEKNMIRHRIDSLGGTGNIPAIKAFRLRNPGVGLKEAKEIVDGWCAANGF